MNFESGTSTVERSGSRLLACLVVCALFWCSGCSVLRTVGLDHTYDGVWKSEGHSFYLAIEQGIAQRYQYTQVSCFQAPAGFLPSVSYIADGRINDWAEIERLENDRMAVTRPQDSFAVELKHIPSLPTECLVEPVSTTLMDLEIVWHSVKENFATFQERDVDWLGLHQRYMQAALSLDLTIFEDPTEAELESFHLINGMLGELGDDHVFLFAPSLGKVSFSNHAGEVEPLELYDDETLHERYLQFMVGTYGWKAPRYYANRQVMFLPLSDKIAYVNIRALRAFHPRHDYGRSSRDALARAMRAIEKRSERFEHLIIDLRFNDGGSIAFANLIASYFGKKKSDTIVLYTKLNEAEGQGYTPAKKAGFVRPNGSALGDKHLYLLTSQFTASAAEYLARNIKASGAIHIGETTRGIFSPVLVRSLPRGWYFSVSNQRATTPTGEYLEGVGIEPDVHKDVNIRGALRQGYDPIISDIVSGNL